MEVRAVFFDSGHTLMRPIGGRWFPGPRFFETCQRHDLAVADDGALAAACDRAYGYLDAHHDLVPDVAAELEQFAEYYRIVLDALELPPSEALVGDLAHAIVHEAVFEPYPTTIELLDEIASRGIPMAIITDAWPSVREKYRQLGLLHYFDAFVISAEQRCTKPDMRMFTPALDAIGVEPADVVFVDDAPDVVAGAAAHGFNAQRIDLEGGDAPITSHSQILDLL